MTRSEPIQIMLRAPKTEPANPADPVDPAGPPDPVELILTAAGAAKCRPCGCAHHASSVLAELPEQAPQALKEAGRQLAATATEQRYACLGCEQCWPAQALNAVAEAALVPEDALACPVEPAVPRQGWPPLPGDYTMLRYNAPVAVCTLGDSALAERVSVAAAADPAAGVAVVGTLTTENLGIERLLHNTITNPNLRFVLVAGPEVDQQVGHHPGGSLLALARNGVDERKRIVDAPGRRPRLINASPEEIAHFRTHVQVIDMIGNHDVEQILAAARDCAQADPGPAPQPPGGPSVPVRQAHAPERTIADPFGYLVVYVDAGRALLVIEHYRNNGLLTAVIEARTASDGYTCVLEAELVSRLDHAAYLGRELARAEHALVSGTFYRQDAAPGQEVTFTEPT